MAGFCPKGPNCQQKHVKAVILEEQASLCKLANLPESMEYPLPHQIANRMQPKAWNTKQPICHHCGKEGHKSTYCQEEKIDRAELAKITQFIAHDKVVCFNCGQKGHYANMCPEKKDRAAAGPNPSD